MMGMRFSERFEKRYIIFQQLLIMTEELTNGICYLSLPLDDIFISIARNGTCKELVFLKTFKELSESGKDFPDAWKQAVYKERLNFKRSECEKIISFGLSLGRSDAENQKRLLKLYSSQFNTYAEEAYALKKRYSLTSVVVGLLSGGAVFILLI